MFSPPLDIDREAVKAFAIVHGVREAARRFNLNENTVSAWSRREKWLERPAAPPPPQLPVTVRPVPALNARTPSEAARSIMEELGERTKSALARGILKGSEHLERLDGEEIIEKAPQIASLTKAAGVVHGWKDGSGGGQTLIQVNVGESFEGPSRDV